MANRTDIIEKIKALRAKSEERGCTEAEAMAAAEVASRLMVKNDIKPEELHELEKAEGVVRGFQSGKKIHPVAEWLAFSIGKFTETRPIISRGVEARYIGLEEDVMMAVYLTEVLVGAAKRSWADTAEEKYYGVPMAAFTHYRMSFFVGFTSRVADRLKELHMARMAMRAQSQGTGHGTALVLVKSEIIARTIEQMGIVIGKARKHENRVYDPCAVALGVTVGDKVNLNRPIEGADENMGVLA